MITFDIGFSVDKKSLESQLDTIHKDIEKAFQINDSGTGGMNKAMSEAVVQARTFERVLKSATTDKGISFIKMNSELTKAGTSMESMVSKLMTGGSAFNDTANLALTSFSNANRQVISMNKTISEMGRVLVQSFKFSLAQEAIQTLQNSLQATVQWVIKLDDQLTQIQVVSGKSDAQMNAVSESIIERSRALRVAAQDYAQASQIYYQQGLQDAEVQRRSEITIKAAQAANESTKAMSDMLTAVWNTYNMQGEELENAASVGAKLGAETAIEFRDIAEAMQISASVAAQAGVEYNSLASIVATVGSVTRQSASVIGNAYKTIFQRFQQLKVDGTDGEVTLKAVSQQLQALGVNVLDSAGNLRELDDVIMETGTNWDNYSQKQQTAIAQLVGGTRQSGQFLALMRNFDDYLTNLNSANSETGAETLEQQYGIAIESIENKLTNASEAWKTAFSSLYNEDAVKGMIDAVADLGDQFSILMQTIGGIQGVLTLVGAYLITKLPQGFAVAQRGAIDFAASLDPSMMSRRIDADFDRIETETAQENGGSLSQTQKIKIDLSRQMAQEQAKLNRVMRDGSAEQKAAAEGLLLENKRRQELLLTIYDETEALNKQAKAMASRDSNRLDSLNNPSFNYKPTNFVDKAGQRQQIPDMGLTKELKQASSLQNSMETSNFGATEYGKRYYDNLTAAITAATEAQETYNNVRNKGNYQEESKALHDAISAYGLLKKQLGESAKAYNDYQSANSLTERSDLKRSIALNQLAAATSDFTLKTEGSSQSMKEALADMVNMEGTSEEMKNTYNEMGALLDKIGSGNVDAWSDDELDLYIEGLKEAKVEMQQIVTEENKKSKENRSNRVIVGAQTSEGVIDRQIQALLQERANRNNQGRTGNLLSNMTSTMSNFGQSASQITSGLTMATAAFNAFNRAGEDGQRTFSEWIGILTMAGPAVAQLTKGSSSLVSVLMAQGEKVNQTNLGLSKMGLSALTAEGGMGALGAGIGSVMSVLAPFIPLVLAAAAALYLWKEAENVKTENQLADQRAAVEGLTEAEEEAKVAADSLRESFESYQTARDSLNSCIEGTDEWSNSLREANDAAIEVLNTVAQLDGVNLRDMYSKENGQIKLNEDAVEAAQKQQDAQVAQATYAKSMGMIRANELSNQLDLENLGKQMANDSNTKNAAAIQQYYNTDGAMGEAAVSAVAISNVLKEQAAEWGDLAPDELQEKLADMGIEVDITSDEFQSYQDAIQKSALAEDNLQVQRELAAERLANMYLDNEKYDENDRDLAAQINSKREQEIFDEYFGDNGEGGILGKFNKVDWMGAGGQDKENLLNDIRKAFNDQTIDAAQNFVRGTDTNRSFALNIDGEEKVYSAREIASRIAASKALEELSVSADKASAVLNQIDMESNEGKSLQDFFKSGNFNTLTEGELNQNFKRDENGDITTDSAKAFAMEAFDIKTDAELEAVAQNLGKTTDEFIQDIINGAEVSFSALNSVGDSLSKRARAVFDEIDLSGVGVGQQKQVENMFNQVFTNFGQQGAKQFGDILEEIPEDQLDSVLEELSTVNWEEITPETLAENLEDAGISIDGLNERLPELISLMQQAAGVSFGDAQKNFKDIRDTFEGIEYGDTIEAADYEKLSAAGKEYFVQMADGTYQMVGSAQDFYRTVQDQALSGYQDAIQQNSNRSAQIQHILDNSDTYNVDNLGQAAEKMTRPEWTGSDGWQYYKDDKVTQQLQYLEASGYGDQNAAQMRDWQAGAENGDLSQDELNAIAQAIQANKQSTEEWKNEQQSLNEETEKMSEILNNQRISDDITQSGIDPKDVEVQQEALKGLIEDSDEAELATYGLSKALLDDNDALREVAKEQARFNEGLQEGAEGLEDWEDIFEGGKVKDQQKFAENLDDMRTAYSNLLDVDADQLGEDFLRNGENLDLFKDILEGTDEEAEAALNSLVENAVSNMDVLRQSMSADEILSNFRTVADEIANMDIGETTPFDSLSESAQNALNTMVAACGDDLSAIETLFNEWGLEPITPDDLMQIPAEGVGVDVEKKTDVQTNEGKTEQTDWTVQDSQPETREVVMTGSGGDYGMAEGETVVASYSIPQWTYTPKKETQTTESETPTVAYNIKPGTGLTKTSTSKSKVANASSPTSDSYRGGGSKPKSSGGNKGSKKKSTYKKPTQKPRYVNNTNRQEATSKAAEKISAVEGQLYGKAKLAAMDKKSKLLAQEARDYQRLYEEAKNYLEQDKAEIANTRLGQTFQIEYDADGNIMNEEQINNWMIDWKDAIDKIEDETQKEQEQMAYDLSETAWEHLKDSVDKMEEYLMEGVSQLTEWIESEIERRNYQYEIDVKVNDRQLTFLDHILTKLGESGLMDGSGLDIVQQQVQSTMNVARSGMETADSLIQLYDQMKTGQIDDSLGVEVFGADVWQRANENGTLVSTIMDAIGDNTEDLLGYADQLAEQYVSAWEQVSAALDSYLSQFDTLDKKMENSEILLETMVEAFENSGYIYKDNAKYIELLGTQLDVTESKVDTARMKYEALAASYEEASIAYETAKEQFDAGEMTGQQFDAVKNMYDQVSDAMLDAQSTWYSNYSDFMSQIKEYEEQLAEQRKRIWSEELGNQYADVLDSQTGYDQYEDLRWFYLDDYEKNYNLDTLLRKTDDAMSDLTDPERLAAYREFMDEINAKQAENVQLTQDDVDILNARFELMQAQDAYEEAKNAKNTMRLTRDASGNYSYVYSGDDSSDAEQQMADAAMNLHQITEEAAKGAADAWYQTMLEYAQYVSEIDQTRYNSDEAYRQQVEMTRQFYEEKMNRLAEKTTEYNDMMGWKFEETAIGFMTNMDNMEDANTKYRDEIGVLFDDINGIYKEYDQKIEDTANQFMNNSEDMSEAADVTMNNIRDQIDETMNGYDELSTNMADNYTQMIADTHEWSQSIIADINEMIEKLEEYYQKQTEVMQNESGETRNYQWMQDEETGRWWYGDGNGGYVKSGWEKINGKYYFFDDEGWMESGVRDSDGNLWVDDGNYRVDESGAYVGDDSPNAMNSNHTAGDWGGAVDTKNWGSTYDEVANGKTDGGQSGANSDYIREYKWGVQNDEHSPGWHWDEDEENWWYATGYKEGQYVKNQTILYKGKKYDFNSSGWLTSPEYGYATGGFTGMTPNQGLDGVDSMPAMLAPGEYVLNSDDTTKILAAVSILKGISSNALAAAAQAINNLATSATQTPKDSSNTVPVQQDVHIDATFPNVSVADEIEDALSNLVNETVQYIGSQNRR